MIERLAMSLDLTSDYSLRTVLSRYLSDGYRRPAMLTAACSMSFLLLTACPALAASTWLAPTDLSVGAKTAEAPQVAVDPQGDATAIWDRFDGSNYVIQVSSRAAGGSWEAPVELSSGALQAYPQIAVDSQGETIAVWDRFTSTSVSVQEATRTPGGAWQSPVTLATEASSPQIAFDPQGDATVIWAASVGGHELIQTTTRPVDGGWESPSPVSVASETDVGHPQISIDSQGDAVAAWGQVFSNVVSASTRAAGGFWQTPVKLSITGEFASYPQLAIDPQGDATAIWSSSPGGSFEAQVSTRPAGGTWQAPIELGDSVESTQIAAGPQGEAMAVWVHSSSGGSEKTVLSSVRPPGGSWQSPIAISTGESAVAPRAAIDQQGDATAVWDYTNGTEYITQAASRPAGGAWQPPVNLSAAGTGTGEPQIAFDSQGNAAAVWRHTAEGADTIQAAGYDASGPQLNGLSIPSAGVAGRPLSFSVFPLDSWSALGQTSWSFGDGAVVSGTSVTHAYASAGSYRVTLTGSDALGNTTTTAATIVIASASASPAALGTPPSAAPTISSLTQTHPVWREGGKLAASARGRKPPLGTTFSLTLNEQARVTYSFSERMPGRRAGGRCVAASPRNRQKRACVRTLIRGTLSSDAHAGVNRLIFQGRLSRTKKLAPGRYTLLASATNALGQSSRGRMLSFTIIPKTPGRSRIH